jgi:hypothetical protein
MTTSSLKLEGSTISSRNVLFIKHTPENVQRNIITEGTINLSDISVLGFDLDPMDQCKW